MSRENTNNKTENVLEISNLCVEYRTRDRVVKAVNGLDLTLKKGQALGVVGETGAGKTTTGLAVLGLIPNPPGVVTEGQIILDGQDVLTKDARYLRGIRGKQVSMIFQDPMTSLNPVLPVNEQIAEVIRTHNKQISKKDALDQCVEMLKRVGIPSPEQRIREFPHQLSGGMRQRVMIAMALLCNPKLLIADEPTTALDVTIQAQILRIIKTLTKESNTSVILITHDMGVVAEVADHVMVMYAGKSVEYGTAEDIFDHPKHPYTIGLLNSIPKLGSGQEEHLYTIEGTVPGLDEMPEGCRFCTRCQHATEQCRKKDPGMREVDGHMVRCFLYGKEGEN